MTKKIVSGVVRFQEKNQESGDVINRVRVHYTDGSTKEFDVIDWEITLEEGRRLWKKHEKNISGLHD
jgi:hypothetical protein